MDATLQALLRFYVFSTGRRLFALQEIKKLAVAGGSPSVAQQCDVAIQHDRSTRALEAKWSSDKDAAQYSPETKQIDIHVDVALGALRDAIDAEARDSAPGDALGQSAANLQQELFPKGVAAITTLPFVEELGEVERIIGVVESAKWADIIKSLGLSRRVARLVELETQYRAAISTATKSVSFGEVKDARVKGQNLMLSVVAAVLGLYPTDSATDLAARQTLLAPILRQNEAIRAYLRQRRAIEDVNPETGEVEGSSPEPQAPTAPTGG